MLKTTSLICAIALLASTACARGKHDAPHVADETVATQSGDITPTSYSVFDLDAEWQDQDGRTVSLEEAAGGRASVLAMVYTNCKATCPLIVADLKRIEQSLGTRQDSVRFILVSLDPERDTPGRLQEWARDTRLSELRWTLLSGSDDAVRELAATLDVRYQRQPDGEMAHTNGIHLIDAAGRVGFKQEGLGDVDATVRALTSLLR